MFFSTSRGRFHQHHSCARDAGRIDGALCCALTTLLPAFLLAACRTTPASPAPAPKYAVLRFENLSANPALDWTGNAIAESLSSMLANALDGPVLAPSALSVSSAALGPRSLVAPGSSAQRAEAIVAGANRIISGYVDTVGNRIRITAAEEDVATHKSLHTVTGEGASLIPALQQLAHNLSPRAGPPPASNPEALEDWARALTTPPAEGFPLLEQATQLDPNFGAPWIALVSLNLAKGDRAAAQHDIASAEQHSIDPVTRARLDFTEAELSGDRTTRLAAMRKVVAVSPGDVLLLRALAESEINAGQFREGAGDWQKVAKESPGDPLVWNSLGYARAYAGDYNGALAAIREYERLRPKDANPSDSIGDVNYMFGRFKEAAAAYLEADKKQPGFGQFAELYKAAWAQFRAGDKSAADSLFAHFRSARLKAAPADPSLALIEADWQYRTGHPQDAFNTLRKMVSGTESERLRSDGNAQLTIYDLLQKDRPQALKDAAAIGPKITERSAFIAWFAAQPSASVSEWQARADRSPPQLRDTVLAHALLLDGKREAALPLWEQLVRSAPGTDFFTKEVYARLQGKKIEQQLLPDPGHLNPFAALPDQL